MLRPLSFPFFRGGYRVCAAVSMSFRISNFHHLPGVGWLLLLVRAWLVGGCQ